jgi:predicted RecB family nuclease
MVIDKGNQHEGDYITQLRDDGHLVEDIKPFKEGRTREEAIALTREAMQRGDKYIYQAALDLPGWYGIADFLEWKELPAGETSNLGNYIYEPIDAKLARSEAKPHHALQLSIYARALEAIQGRPPEFIYIQLAREHDAREAIRLSEIEDYCAGIARQLEEFVADPPETEPYPVSHCSFCDFQKDCEQWLADNDHLSLVAGITRSQVTVLREAGVATMAQLAERSPDDAPAALRPLSYRRIQEQARLQDASRGAAPGEEQWEPVDAEVFSDGDTRYFGFRRLPSPHLSDVILDLEGHPLWTPKDGLVFLFGYLADFGNGMEYRAIWVDVRGDYAAMKAAEKAAFEEFIDFLVAQRRGDDHVGWHLYHYGNAETTMLKQLAQTHGTRELELDHLLRSNLLVDLSTIVKQTVRIGIDSYSLKRVEKVAGFDRKQTLSKGAAAVIEYEHWISDGKQDRLDDIEHYNAEDCWGTLAVRDWLEGMRPADAQYTGPVESEPKEPSPERVARLELRNRILERCPMGTPEALAAELLPYHQREQRSEWWAYFERKDDQTVEELVADADSLGRLSLSAERPPYAVQRSQAFTYDFSEQEYKIGRGSMKPEALWPDRSTTPVEVVELDHATETVTIKLGPKPQEKRDEVGDPIALIPGAPLGSEDIEGAIGRFVGSLVEMPIDPAKAWGRYPAIEQLLRREPPMIVGRNSGDVLQTTELEEIKELVRNMDGATMVTQGPPGTGKTWTGARLILDLIDQGKRIGITSHSHKAIDNLVNGIEEAARKEGAAPGTVAVARQKGGELDFAADSPVTVSVPTANADILADPALIVAGTAWVFSPERWDVNNPSTPDEQKLDYLFIDEASQVALANTVAVGTAARNLVLLGDPQQLPQVAKGVHPEGAGASALKHFLGERPTIPETHGLFLEVSWRMHPSICDFVSQRMYEGRLQSHPDCGRQSVGAVAELCFHPVVHHGNASRSPEEARFIKDWIDSHLGVDVVDRDGKVTKLKPEDIMVVTPYNAQFRELDATLPAGVRIGTVDRFQGQEAPVVFYSMATSDGESMPRSVDFLFSRNRLNVAISRAQALALVIGAPQLKVIAVNSLPQIRDVSFVCSVPTSITRQEGS